jgi:uncharacterized protein
MEGYERSWPAEHRAAVSFLASGLRHHVWVVEQRKRLRPPLLTCEPVPVLTEAAFLLKREGYEADALFAGLEQGVIRIALTAQDKQTDLRSPMRQYRNRSMSPADACMVRLSDRRSLHAGLRFADLPETWQQSNPGPDA